MPNRTCTVGGCAKPTRTPVAAYCEAHYTRWYRYGDPTFRPRRGRDLTGQRFGTLVAVRPTEMGWYCECDCGGTRDARVNALFRIESPTCDNSHHRRIPSLSSYDAAHNRLVTDRGAAKTHRCVDCLGRAQQWSYNHTDPDEETGDTLAANGLPYSMKQEHYSPRCVPCHKVFDLEVIRSRRVA